MITLVLGGARSGKTRYALSEAQRRAAESRNLVMIATAAAGDDEMSARIARHREERGPLWRTIEEPLALPAIVAREASANQVIVVDCLTLWLTNLMLADEDVEACSDALLQALTAPDLDIFLISNEVGLGIVPDNALARRFRDEAGRLHQRIAATADRVVLVVAGIPMIVKGAQA
ncbi:bifunctional adenosylcobinamide kinase/adenosylcobinamide-phosphate guanylyltransferase [Roseiterribacter gracilis]|uniref:Bifunctional adenosylcobalamin biosynthesis protein n=1 Tax=Roseiterribacter gracilis TaxID=2812848 RepID=A0A8S8X9D5_9PROT|nr:bifunctional adenosylcobalamin biosynthesis protein CobP [Rhodospirillales bacterium TMPK1]